MDTTTNASSAESTRSVASAANTLVHAIRTDGYDVGLAFDRLESNAKRTVGDSTRGFAPVAEPSDQELLESALAQLSIGATLCVADGVLIDPARVGELQSAAASLAFTSDVLENVGRESGPIRGFDGTGDADRSVLEVARESLDSLSTAAAEVTTSLLDKTFRPVVDQVPTVLRDLVTDLDVATPSRLLTLALRAIRRGLSLLLRLADFTAVERLRADLDEVLTRLGRGEDGTVIAGWAIGATSVGKGLTEPVGAEKRLVARRLGDLVRTFDKVCTILGRIAVVITGLAGVLALVQITLPQAAALTSTGLVLVLAALVLAGRDHTGATDLPGRVRGVRLLVEDHHAPS
ncbi:hypothetical protein ACFFQW_22110 [Umezawaea endophytica]|uniref:Uncharacterized protein n=1 Tax=Umezawaea endophytica TaxID=1654476 RepID=A0A9X2VJW8_9PSEU|nr:hypothetical protein [Umezawaea endophytica]MCS7477442.1 hypothetical protein [Umezawaea endophytica]